MTTQSASQGPEPVTLHDLRRAVPASRVAGANPAIVDIVLHDGELDDAGPGVMFACCPSRTRPEGDRDRRLASAHRAIERGATAVLVAEDLASEAFAVPLLVVPDVHAVLGACAALVHGDPSATLPVVLTTGTDGKTTTTFMTVAALEAGLGGTVGMLSTVHSLVGGVATGSALTTPEAPEIQRQMRRMLQAGDVAVAMEASSVALLQHRVRGVRGRVGVFTNLTPEHLDLHGDMETYFRAKELLFIDGYVDTAVIVVDTDPGRRMAESARSAGLELVTVSIEATEADVVLVESIGPTAARARVHGEERELRVPLPGRHNISNALCAVAAAAAADIDVETALAGIAAMGPVPGRFERVPDPAGLVHAFVDYAHTPAAVEVAMRAGRELADDSGGRLWAIVGCGGDRDPHKRGDMGRVVAEGADVAILTSDNPRSEDPDLIVATMQAGIPEVAQNVVRVELERERAIAMSVSEARPCDVIVIAGKGHERQQTGRNGPRDFDDRVILAEALAATAAARLAEAESIRTVAP